MRPLPREGLKRVRYSHFCGIIRQGMHADTGAIIDTFGKNEQVRKVFWPVFAAIAGLVLMRVLDPGTAQQVVGMIVGLGG